MHIKNSLEMNAEFRPGIKGGDAIDRWLLDIHKMFHPEKSKENARDTSNMRLTQGAFNAAFNAPVSKGKILRVDEKNVAYAPAAEKPLKPHENVPLANTPSPSSSSNGRSLPESLKNKPLPSLPEKKPENWVNAPVPGKSPILDSPLASSHRSHGSLQQNLSGPGSTANTADQDNEKIKIVTIQSN